MTTLATPSDQRSSSPRLKLIDFQSAQELLEAAFDHVTLRTEKVSVDQAQGRVAAEDVFSNANIPAFTVSAMDGYAIQANSVERASFSNPVRLTTRLKNLDETPAYYVSTGSEIPPGCDAVVRLEEARRSEDGIILTKSIPKYSNIVLEGEDIRKGHKIIQKSKNLGPSDVALLIGIGESRVKVCARPKVSIISIGNDLCNSNDELRGVLGVPNNYSDMIEGIVKEYGGAQPIKLGIVRKEISKVQNAVKEAVENSDIVITVGGTSVGSDDLTGEAILRVDSKSRIIFHGLKLLPIKPAGIALVAGKPVVMLPGHSVSAFLAFVMVVVPVLNMLSGLAFDARKIMINAEAGAAFSNPRAIDALTLVSLKKNGPDYVASPLRWGSNLLSSLTEANGFVYLPARKDIPKSERVSVRLFSAVELSRVT